MRIEDVKDADNPQGRQQGEIVIIENGNCVVWAELISGRIKADRKSKIYFGLCVELAANTPCLHFIQVVSSFILIAMDREDGTAQVSIKCELLAQ